MAETWFDTGESAFLAYKHKGGALTRLPKPAAVELAHEKVWASNTGRNAADGKLVGDIKAFKYTVKCEWGGLGPEAAAVIEASASEENTTLYFMGPNGAQMTMKAYTGTPTYTFKTIKEGKPIMDVKLDYIEV